MLPLGIRGHLSYSELYLQQSVQFPYLRRSLPVFSYQHNIHPSSNGREYPGNTAQPNIKSSHKLCLFLLCLINTISQHTLKTQINTNQDIRWHNMPQSFNKSDFYSGRPRLYRVMYLKPLGAQAGPSNSAGFYQGKNLTVFIKASFPQLPHPWNSAAVLQQEQRTMTESESQVIWVIPNSWERQRAAAATCIADTCWSVQLVNDWSVSWQVHFKDIHKTWNVPSMGNEFANNLLRITIEG